MQFSELCAQIDAQLDADPQLAGSRSSAQPDESIWALSRNGVIIRSAGSTGIEIIYQVDDHEIHRRTFAASPMSIGRIVRTATEHLTGYRVREPQGP